MVILNTIFHLPKIVACAWPENIVKLNYFAKGGEQQSNK